MLFFHFCIDKSKTRCYNTAMGMSKAMLEDYVKQVKKTLRIQRIVIIVLAVLLALTLALAMSSFEIEIDDDTEVDYQVEQNGRDNSNSVTINGDNQTYIICGTIMVCVAIITTGVVAYGKSKNTYNDTQASSDNHTQEKHI